MESGACCTVSELYFPHSLTCYTDDQVSTPNIEPRCRASASADAARTTPRSIGPTSPSPILSNHFVQDAYIRLSASKKSDANPEECSSERILFRVNLPSPRSGSLGKVDKVLRLRKAMLQLLMNRGRQAINAVICQTHRRSQMLSVLKQNRAMCIGQERAVSAARLAIQ